MRLAGLLALTTVVGMVTLTACGSSAVPAERPSAAQTPSAARASGSPSVPLVTTGHGRWQGLPAGPLPPLEMPVGVWTGQELVITGLGSGTAHAAAYRPSTRTWRQLPAPDVASDAEPDLRGHRSAVWTGKDVVVLGLGYCHAFDPAAGVWRRLRDPGNITGSSNLAVAWTGTQVLVWGLDGPNAGWSLDPAQGTWTALPEAPVEGATAAGVWTGTEFVVQTGATADNDEVTLQPAVAYDPSRRVWRTLPAMPEARVVSAEMIWTGTEAVVIGGTIGDDTYLPPTQSAYDPVKNTWRTLTAGQGLAHGERMGHHAIWTGRQVLVWGGGQYDLTARGARFVPAPGTAYDPAADSWLALPASPLTGRTDPVVAWTGASLLVWGGGVFPGGSASDNPRAVADGALYTP